MTFCWHRYTKWKTMHFTTDSDFGGVGVAQYRECTRCGKGKVRSTLPR